MSHERVPLRSSPGSQVIAAKEAGSAAPVRNIEGNTFLYTRHKDMFFVAVTRTNANAGRSRRATHGPCQFPSTPRACMC